MKIFQREIQTKEDEGDIELYTKIQQCCSCIKTYSSSPNEQRKKSIRLTSEYLDEWLTQNNVPKNLINCKEMHRIYIKLEQYLITSIEEDEIKSRRIYFSAIKIKEILKSSESEPHKLILERILKQLPE